MGEQRTFAAMAWAQKGKVTRRERFLAEMDAVIPWARLVALIEPHYPKAGQRPAAAGAGERCCGCTCLQQWFDLSDPQAEDMLLRQRIDAAVCARWNWARTWCRTRARSCGFAICSNAHQLTAAIFEAVNELLSAKRLLLKAGSIVDATIIAAPTSTKNATQGRGIPR